MVGETDAPPPRSAMAMAEEDRQAVGEAVARYVAEQYATEAVRLLLMLPEHPMYMWT